MLILKGRYWPAYFDRNWGSGRITELILANCGIGPKALAILCSALPVVTGVDLSYNPLTGGAPILSSIAGQTRVTGHEVGGDLAGLKALRRIRASLTTVYTTGCGIVLGGVYSRGSPK